MYPPPLHWHPTSCFINPHYYRLSAASTTSSTSNDTAHFPDHKNLSYDLMSSFFYFLSVIRVSLLNVISLMEKLKWVIFNVFFYICINLFEHNIYPFFTSTYLTWYFNKLVKIKNAPWTLLCSCTYPRATVQDRNNFGWHPRHKRSDFHFRD